ncbi:MAG: SDR family NAD(P)-dependent oxidoreductase [Synechococcaceae bacterium WBA_2_066]|nr:SDR family NAD(P)-dependent oxidoreductase [Synechococcaceae bacterium WB6_1A_059]NBQ18506.1 SDR family NAD(P)-dependent oxidoreductase [Synechococcaceae bacterium WB5_2A_257]NBR43932.1 SDR family NAD(P)-dependent oxidoreductase [Synechococcaceae bacterium WB5_2B_268]NBY59106.1 SDR family NAD(P)-dependent oxidoreductase [Synechococcaceae bacterium LLD_019]NCU76371.1 SDR family NAD(P)-dependent oxidoreductase [Synechococcaceae bacterium WB7_1C_051]NCU91671.1 SDR family NAD(P)-dependent oxido
MGLNTTAWNASDCPDQSGRVALITGANSGLGLETARVLVGRGATVLMACRSRERAEHARRQLLPAVDGGAIDLIDLDLGDLASVQRAVRQVEDCYGRLDLLINNAGVMGLPRTLTRDGFECQFGINHLGHFALTNSLLPLMQGRNDARVVSVSSGAQYFGRINFNDLQAETNYDRWKAYGQSKLANVMFAVELQHRLSSSNSNVQSFVAHPGVARTNLQPTSVAASGSRLEPLAYRLMAPLFQSAAMGALPQLFAATAKEANPSSQYGPNQWGGMRGWPTAVPMAPAAKDLEQRKKLWEISTKLCNINDDIINN